MRSQGPKATPRNAEIVTECESYVFHLIEFLQQSIDYFRGYFFTCEKNFTDSNKMSSTRKMNRPATKRTITNIKPQYHYQNKTLV